MDARAFAAPKGLRPPRWVKPVHDDDIMEPRVAPGSITYQASFGTLRMDHSLDELQEAVGSTSKDGYHDHHIAEQKAARDAGDLESLIQSRDNLVRIPILKHIDITSYYVTKIEQEDGSMLSPRERLKGKDFETRRHFGLDMLRRYGVLK
jgi:hypothetical protein